MLDVGRLRGGWVAETRCEKLVTLVPTFFAVSFISLCRYDSISQLISIVSVVNSRFRGESVVERYNRYIAV